MLALVGVTLSLGGLKAFVTSFAGNLNQLATAADAFGMSAKSLDGWTKAGEAFGVSANEIVGSFSRINDAKARLKAGLGLDPQLQSLLLATNQAGANVDLSRDSTDDIMSKLVSAFPRLNKDQQQAYGGELGWGYAFQQWAASGHALQDKNNFTSKSGVDDQSIAAARRFRLQWAEINQAFEKTGYILFNALLPYIEKFNAWLNSLATWMASHPDEIQAAVVGFLDTIKGIARVANDAANAVGGWEKVIIALLGLKLATWLIGVAAGFKSIFALAPPAWVLAGAGVVAASGVEVYQRTKALINGEKYDQIPTQSEEMNELERLKRLNWSKNNPGVPYHGSKPNPTKEGAALLGWLQPKLNKLEETFGLPTGLLRSMAITESGGDPYAVSGAGAKGLFQFMPGTAKDFGLKGGDVFDPEKSAGAAARYMSQLLQMFDGDLGTALAAYNWGQGNVMRKGLGAAPKETRDYVPKIFANLPQPGAGMSAQSRQPITGSQSTVTESIHIGTLNATTTADNVKGIADDARQRISRSSLVGAYSSGVST